VIDTGFSHTHIVPTLLGNPWNAGIRRIDIGGKFLTNYLKELVSLRTWNMMDEPYLISQVKEAVCYVAKDFSADLEKCKRLRNAPAYRNDIVREYVLPNYNTPGMGIGYARIPTSSSSTAPTSKSLETPETNTEEQIMTLSNERFTVPELLFHPSDVGLTQAGIAECTTQSLSTVPDRFHPVLLANIVLVGGNAAIPGFKDRFVQEIRSLVDVNMHVRVGVPQEPVKYTWMGAARMAADERVMAKKVVSRAEYGEHGLVWAQRRMAGEEVRGGGDVVEKETAPVKDTITSTRSERRESRSHKKRRVTDASS
jgi:actin-related protein 6